MTRLSLETPGRARSLLLDAPLGEHSIGMQVVAIGTFSSHVSLFFSRGREIDDGSGLLGAGKDALYITLRAPTAPQ